MKDTKLPDGITLRTTSPDMVCSYEQSKELKKLGLAQHANFFFVVSSEVEFYDSTEIAMLAESGHLRDKELFAAYTSDQLAAVLGSCACSLAIEEDSTSFVVHYKDPIDGMMGSVCPTLPQALAHTVIHILKTRRKPLDEANRWLMYV